MSHSAGELVRLESGAWAQYRQVPVLNATAPMLIAVELTEEEVRRLLPRLDPQQPADSLH